MTWLNAASSSLLKYSTAGAWTEASSDLIACYGLVLMRIVLRRKLCQRLRNAVIKFDILLMRDVQHELPHRPRIRERLKVKLVIAKHVDGVDECRADSVPVGGEVGEIH